MKSVLFCLLLVLLAYPWQANSQIRRDSTLADSTRPGATLNMDAVYNRPFLSVGKFPVAVGGYLETLYEHKGTDGISEGHQFQFQRMTLFVSASIYSRLRFLSEIEFEEGGKEIAIEFAAADLELDPLLNVRAGIVMNPIGAFNQNHDGPKWEFSSRPVSATRMLPATWSNVGAGLYGKKYLPKWVVAYEAYLTNGFDSRIINNPEGRTFLPATKENPERFTESSSGIPMLTAKGAIRNYRFGEVGLSYMGGVYNKFRSDGIIIDQKRRVDTWAVDYNTRLPVSGTYLTGEFAWVRVDVPRGLQPMFGRLQHGGFLDIVQPIYKKPLFRFSKSELRLALRLEYVDWNVGRFTETGGRRGDELKGLTAGLSWRPVSQTVFRLAYLMQRTWDLAGNPPARTGGVQIGFATYF